MEMGNEDGLVSKYGGPRSFRDDFLSLRFLIVLVELLSLLKRSMQTAERNMLAPVIGAIGDNVVLIRYGIDFTVRDDSSSSRTSRQGKASNQLMAWTPLLIEMRDRSPQKKEEGTPFVTYVGIQVTPSPPRPESPYTRVTLVMLPTTTTRRRKATERKTERKKGVSVGVLGIVDWWYPTLPAAPLPKKQLFDNGNLVHHGFRCPPSLLPRSRVAIVAGKGAPDLKTRKNSTALQGWRRKSWV